MRARKLTAQQTTKIWKAFYDAYGPEQMMASYGWYHAPETVKDKKVYAFGEKDACVGWGAMSLNTSDATDTEAWLSVGVFPDHQGQGYRLRILEWLAKKAIAFGADQVAIIVLRANEANYKRTLREGQVDNPKWKYAGDVWYPNPGYGYFVYVPLEPVTEPNADGQEHPPVPLDDANGFPSASRVVAMPNPKPST